MLLPDFMQVTRLLCTRVRRASVLELQASRSLTIALHFQPSDSQRSTTWPSALTPVSQISQALVDDKWRYQKKRSQISSRTRLAQSRLSAILKVFL